MVTGTVFSICAEQSGTPLLRLFHSVVPPFRRPYEEHRHTAFELALIRTGGGVYRAGKSVYRFQAGDVFLFSSNEPHCIVEVFDGSALDIMNLQFEPRFLWSPENLLFQVQYPDIFFRRNGRFSQRLSALPSPAEEVRRQLLGVEQEFVMQRTDYKLMVKLQVLALLVFIRRSYADFFDQPCRRVKPMYLAQMERALDYIDQHLTGELHLDMVARQAAMSPSYFSTLFKKLNGLTLWEYVQSRRIELAADQLTSSDRNIAEIALACGYNSLSNFNRSFKAVTGQTPGAYRKLSLEVGGE